MTHEFTYRRRVEFAETDAAGVAHFAGFFRWMEEAEHAFYRSVGGSAYREGPHGIGGMPRAAASCEYLRPVRYGEELDVRLVVREMTERSISYVVEFRREEAELVARGSMRVVHVERPHGVREWRVTDLPAVLRAEIEPAPGT